jgi:hypothetical protein
MKNLQLSLTFSLIFILKSLIVSAQDLIYTNDGRTLEGRVVEMKSNKFRYKKSENLKEKMFTIKKEDVVLIFNRNGTYLSMANLPKNADDIINDYLGNAEFNDSVFSLDRVITSDNQILVGEFITEVDENIKFRDQQGNVKTIEKGDILAIIYRDGTHKLMLYPSISATGLARVREKINELNDQNAQGAITPMAATTPVEEKKEVVVEPVKPMEISPAIAEKTGIEDLDDVSFKEYEQKALNKVNDLTVYMSKIANKATDFGESGKAIDLAVALFVSEESVVEVSSVKTGNRNKYKVRKYFNNLKLLKYDKISIEWTNINYVSNLKKGDDGNYHGTISYQQEFKGYKDGKVVYSDITEKNVEVILKTYMKNVDGESKLLWDVFLEDIGVEQDRQI